MSISGQVTFDNTDPAIDVYVVAILDRENSRSGFHIIRTDGNGDYRFEQLLEGGWKVGIYKQGYDSTPPMRYESLFPGIEVINADFVLSTSTAITGDNISLTPTIFLLAQNYPNPFNPKTSIEYSLPEAVKVKVDVHNTLGQVVEVLVDRDQEAGYHKVIWDASDMASGIYFYRLTTGDFTATKRMVLMK